MRFFSFGRRAFSDLNEREILALAISAEEDDGRIYATYAERLDADYPATAAIFREMEREEDGHRRALIAEHERRFGPTIPLIRREHVTDDVSRRPVWLVENLGLEQNRAEAERGHQTRAGELEKEHLSEGARADEATDSRRQLILTLIQPGLAGLMDGSVSTLAPIFATAFATRDPAVTLTVGLAAAIGARISMGFTEAAHDDGKLSGRGSPIKRGLATGLMTTLGGLGHALPYLIQDFWTATIVAFVVVFLELWAIVWIQNRFMETPILRATTQVIIGGALVLAAGILIGGG